MVVPTATVILPRGDSPLPAKEITLRSASSILTHRIPPHLDAMGVVHEPVEDAIGQRGISYLFVPPRDRQLRGSQDVCLGFCYDPLAALGFVTLNQPCFARTADRAHR